MNFTYVEATTTILVAALGALSAWLRRSEMRKTQRLNDVEHELKANSGASLRDAVDRIERSVVALTSAVEAARVRIETLEHAHTRRWWR